MKALALALAPAVLIGLGTKSDPDEFAFGVRAETSLSKTFEEEMTWDLELIDVVIGKDPVTADVPGCSGTTRRWIDVTDEYVETEDGQTHALRRTFDRIATESLFDVESLGSKRCISGSELEEATVLFRWDGDEFEPSFEGAGPDRSLLDGLEQDMDLLAFLPESEVGIDDTWEVDPIALARVLAPGGQLTLLPHEADEGNPQEIPTQYILGNALFNLGEIAAELEGEAEATYVSRNEDGLAKISVEFYVESEVDLAERFDAFLVEGMDDPETDDLKLELAVELEGKATLLWDLEAGRIESVELDGDYTLTANIAWLEPTFVSNGEPMRFAANLEIGGTTRVEMVVTAN